MSNPNLFRLIILLAGGALLSTSSFASHNSNNTTKPARFVFEEATIDSVHYAIKHQQINCKQLVNSYLKRIKLFNLSAKRQAPLNAFSMINPLILDQARELDDFYAKTHKLMGPLHCVPVILKDNIDTYDTPTTVSSLSLLGNQPIADAFVTARLRQAGAIIIGKGAMDEYAYGMIGVGSHTGRVGNAYDPARNPGGSSAGSAVAVSANFALVGIGTDNSGSVRIPAAFNGIVGLRPSTGLISQQGIFPMGNLDGTAGPLARTVKDLAILMDVLVQRDSMQTNSKTVVPQPKTYTAFLNDNGLQGKRIGIVHWVGKINTFKEIPSDILMLFQETFQKMQQLGATLVAEVNLDKFDIDRQYNQAGEIDDINDYLASFPATRKNFRDICESDRTRSFGTVDECIHFMNATAKKNSWEYSHALATFKNNKSYIEFIMDKYHLDALLIPISSSGSATYDVDMVNTWRAPVSSNSGLPAIAFNVGYGTDKMPVGIELVARQFAEPILIEMAYAYEKHSPPRITPNLPQPNSMLENYSITEINNLLTVIGMDAYQQVLMKGDPEDLTSEVFRKIVNGNLAKFQ